MQQNDITQTSTFVSEVQATQMWSVRQGNWKLQFNFTPFHRY